ncbi:hypothetical protein [Humidisolicoccus flavus]|uniref:hypothetical protein n=1 Tax=Humidisolicoccus flavus TaxID=3111414 RepID=UPI00324FBA6B
MSHQSKRLISRSWLSVMVGAGLLLAIILFALQAPGIAYLSVALPALLIGLGLYANARRSSRHRP